MEDFIKEDTDMPDELIRNVTGDLLFEQTLPLVWPIQHFADQRVAQASVSLCNKHRSAWPSCRLLQQVCSNRRQKLQKASIIYSIINEKHRFELQRQKLDAKPVTEVDVNWKEWKSRFWVFGKEKKVHSPDYPHTCCWGCTIL